MFEKASRMKLRFDTPVGRLPVEDIWDLPLLGGRNDACLDELAKTLHRELKGSQEESFVIKTAEPNEKLALRFEIVKHVIHVKLEEKDAAENAELARQKKAQILAIIADKEMESLKEANIDDLRALIDSL
jgi:hypothetical protein